jgi:hypothetical protein
VQNTQPFIRSESAFVFGFITSTRNVGIIDEDKKRGRFATIASLQETGECGERQLHLSDGEAGRFYRDLSDAEFACVWGWRLPLQVLGKGGCSYRSWRTRLIKPDSADDVRKARIAADGVEERMQFDGQQDI